MKKDIEQEDEPEFIHGIILIVDDEQESARILAKLLEVIGYTTNVAYSGAEAIEKIEETEYDVVITDLRMPGMSGLELIENVRQGDNKMEFIITTGYGSIEQEVQTLRAGATDFIHKPIDKDHLCHVLRRVMEKKELQKKLLARTTQLVQAEKMATVGLLSTGIAHEINNPTTFIRTNLQLMKEYIKRLKPRFENITKASNAEAVANVVLTEFPQMIDEALGGTDRIHKIVSGVKHYAHIDSESAGSPVDIRDVIAHSVTMVRAKLRQNITITENYLNIKAIVGQFSKLEQVFVNLLVNAADAINGKVTQRRAMGDKEYMGEIDVSAMVIDGSEEDDTPDYLVLTFYDNGGGIPAAKIKRIFDPFFTTKGVGAGTGLGLYICYEIIHQHGGDISVQSSQGEGTAFIIKIPTKPLNSKREE